ncbi:MAG: hypothetical protein AAGM67_00450 [Bacteroidota bacterium]
MGVGQIALRLISKSLTQMQEATSKSVWLEELRFLEGYSDFFSHHFQSRPVCSEFQSSTGEEIESKRWSKGRNIVEVYISKGDVTNISIKLELGHLDRNLLRALCDFALINSCLFISLDDLEQIPADEEKLRKAINSSRASQIFQHQ